MLDLKLLQKQPEVVAAALAARHSAISLDEFLDLDRRRRAALAEVEALKSKRNTESAEVAAAKRLARTPRTWWPSWAFCPTASKPWMWKPKPSRTR